MDADATGEGEPDCRGEVVQSLLTLLRVDNLVVLTGLGASLCVQDVLGDRLFPTMDDLWDAARTNTGDDDFSELLSKVKYPKPKKKAAQAKKAAVRQTKDIELLLSKCHIYQAYSPTPDVDGFIKETESLIVKRCDVLDGAADLETHEAFLRRIARRSTRLPRTRVFTTNYDLCFETAASRINFIAVDGFSHTLPQEFDASHFGFDLVRRPQESESAPEYIPNVFQLYKLHGSVDWDQSTLPIRRARNPQAPVLVYPRHSKFESSYEHPFFELMAQFQAALRRPKTALIVIGFGFADKHVTNPILSALRSNVGISVLVVDPALEEHPSAAATTMKNLIDQGDQRISLLAASFEEFVPLLPDLVAETERERHQLRFRELDT